MRLSTVATLLVLTAAAPLSAQSTRPAIDIGDRIRIDQVRTGTLAERHGRVMIIQPDADPTVREEVLISDIDRLEVWRCCNRGQGFVRGALAGVGAALVGGVVLQAMPAAPGTGANMAMVGVVLVGVPLGIGIGGAIGSRALASEDWVEVDVPRP